MEITGIKIHIFISSQCAGQLWQSVPGVLIGRRMKNLLSFPGRKWREKNTLGGTGKWQVEVGEPTSPLLGALESELITESSSNVCKGLQVPLHLKLPCLVLTAVVGREQITKRQP